MKILFRALSTAALSTALLAPVASAQDAVPAPAGSEQLPPPPAIAPASNTPPAIAPAAESAPSETKSKPAPAKKAASKPAAKKPASTPAASAVSSEPLLSPEPALVRSKGVNLRGQAAINSEVVGKVNQGEVVTVLEAVELKKPKQDEPSRWYKVALPSSISVWVHSTFINKEDNTVKPNRLNLRGGPGENYSVLGRINRGDTVKVIDRRGDWLKIEPPATAYAFVAAHLVERGPAAIAAAKPRGEDIAAIKPATPSTPATPVTPPAPAVEPITPPTPPPPTVAEVTPTPAPATPAELPTTPTPTPEPTPAPTPMPAETAPATPATPAPAPAESEPAAPIETVRKVVSREGILRGSVSIQAPTYFELRSLDTGKSINYVFSPSTNLVLKEFKGKRVIVTGEEVLDERWQSTPVLVVDSLQTVP